MHQNICKWVNQGKQRRREGVSAETGACKHNLELTVVLGEGKIQAGGALFVAPTILPDGSMIRAKTSGQRPNTDLEL